MKYLLLWDIDGTLILSGGAGARALRVALREVFAIEDSLETIDFAGRTDTYILRAIFQQVGIPPTPENFALLFDGYLAALPAALRNPEARVLPGVRAILDAASTHGAIAQGLLTGNMRRSAQAKLEYHGLWERFDFGAFGDDAELRNDLGPHALRRALERHGVQFPAENVWVIGDTPHDIACGQAIGARTLAVATGSASYRQLAEYKPTATVADLSDTAGLLRLFAS